MLSLRAEITCPVCATTCMLRCLSRCAAGGGGSTSGFGGSGGSSGERLATPLMHMAEHFRCTCASACRNQRSADTSGCCCTMLVTSCPQHDVCPVVLQVVAAPAALVGAAAAVSTCRGATAPCVCSSRHGHDTCILDFLETIIRQPTCSCVIHNLVHAVSTKHR